MEASAAPRTAPAGVAGILTPRVLRMASDSHLVTLIREGRAAAFEALYDRHHRAILSFCHHVLGTPEEAEDAVQHTFLAAYNALQYSDEPIHLRAWLFAIARNRCYSILRRRREQPLEAVEELGTEGIATHAQVQLRQDLRDLVLDVRRLPDDQRAALVLAELEALSHEQIALVLGVPTRKVKALVFQARESLLASRSAREVDCAEIRQQLANLSGGALRRSHLRRHLRDCTGCQEFRELVDDQRRHLRVLIPVAPSIALKEALIASTVGGGAAGGGLVGTGVVATSALKGAAVKSLVGAVLAGAGAAGTVVAVRGAPHVPDSHGAPKYAVSSHVGHSRAGRAGGGGGGGDHARLASAGRGGSSSSHMMFASYALPTRSRVFEGGHHLVARAAAMPSWSGEHHRSADRLKSVSSFAGSGAPVARVWAIWRRSAGHWHGGGHDDGRHGGGDVGAGPAAGRDFGGDGGPTGGHRLGDAGARAGGHHRAGGARGGGHRD